MDRHISQNVAQELYEALDDVVRGTEDWNRAIEKIIGKQPQTGIGLGRAKEALAKARGAGELPQ